MLDYKLSQNSNELAEMIIYANTKLEDLNYQSKKLYNKLETLRTSNYSIPDNQKSLAKYLHDELIHIQYEIINLENLTYNLSETDIKRWKKESDFKSYGYMAVQTANDKSEF